MNGFQVILLFVGSFGQLLTDGLSDGYADAWAGATDHHYQHVFITTSEKNTVQIIPKREVTIMNKQMIFNNLLLLLNKLFYKLQS